MNRIEKLFQFSAAGTFAAVFAMGVFALPIASYSQTNEISAIFRILLQQELSTCYVAPTEQLKAEDEIILDVSLDANGDVSDLPEFVNFDALSFGERALVRQAVGAIVMCAPILSDDGEKAIVGSFKLTVKPTGISVSEVNANVMRLRTEDQNVLVLPGNKVETSSETPAVDPASATGVAENADRRESTDTADNSGANTDIPDETEISADLQDDIGHVSGVQLAGGTEATEAAMELTRTELREIQRRLTLLGYTLGTVDGVFGPKTRNAISRWQMSYGYRLSGYLNEEQVARLWDLSQASYVQWTSRPSTPQYYYDQHGCLRHPSGKIVTGRTFNCDMSAAGQSLGFSN